MARKAIEIDAVTLQDAIFRAEAAQPTGQFAARSQLWAAVAALDSLPKASPQTWMLKAESFGLVMKTPVAQKGRQAGQKVPQAQRRKKKRIPLDLIEPLRKQLGPDNENLLNKIINGSLMARVKANCILCSGGSKKEVGLCINTGCMFYTVRPFKHPLTKTVKGRKIIEQGMHEATQQEENDFLVAHTAEAT